jgi:hypothetical protein
VVTTSTSTKARASFITLQPASTGNTKRLQYDPKIKFIFAKILEKSGQKIKDIDIKADFEKPKHQLQSTFETLKYLQQTIC